MATSDILDAILVPVGVLLIAAYNVTLYYRVKLYPLSTVIGVNHLNRDAWVRSIMRVRAPMGPLASQNASLFRGFGVNYLNWESWVTSLMRAQPGAFRCCHGQQEPSRRHGSFFGF